MTKTPLPTNTSTNAWEKLPKKLQRAFGRKKVHPVLLIGGDELFFAEITEDLELKVLATAQPGTELGDVDLVSGAKVIITDGTDDIAISGDGLQTKRSHSDSVRGTVSTTALTNNNYSELRAAAAISATKDAYITDITVYLKDAAAFNNAAGEGLLVMFLIGSTTTTDFYWCGSLTNDAGDISHSDGTLHNAGKSWNFATPKRVPANTNFRILAINNTGNTLDNVRVTWNYYLE